MYQYLFDDNTTQRVKDSTNKTKSVLEQFSDIDKKYTFGKQTDQDLSLKRMEYNAPSQLEVQNKAQNSLQDYKKNSLEKINKNYDLQKQKLTNDIEAEKENQKTQKQEIVDVYTKVKNDASNDAIKRGLARSSIIVNKLENYDNNMMNDLAVLSDESNKKIDNLSTQKNTLELEKSNALKSFDIEYAVKLQDKIDSINEEIAKNEQAALKYNNQIAELEAKWKKAMEEENYEREKDASDFAIKYGQYAIETLKRNEKYQLAKEYFANMDKNSALNELLYNSSYKENLGETNYEKLVKEIGAK